VTLGDELVLRARAEAEQLQAVVSPAGLESMRAEAMQLFEQLPEPPAYRKANDPARDKAGQLVPRATELLSRLLAARKAVPTDARLPSLVRAGRGPPARPGGHLRRESHRGRPPGPRGLGTRPARRRAAAPSSSCRGTRRPRRSTTGDADLALRPAPRADAHRAAVLRQRGLPQAAAYIRRPALRHAPLHLSVCRKPFTGHFAEVRAGGVEEHRQGGPLRAARRAGRRRREHPGVRRRLRGELAVAPRDLVVCSTPGPARWRRLENLTTGHVCGSLPRAVLPGHRRIRRGRPGADDFRAFRDRALLPSRAGRALVAAYYRIGPRVAPAVRRRPALRRAARAGLEAIRLRIRS
jgi:hypothetical protein